MEQRRIGRTDLTTSCLGIGGARFGKPGRSGRREVERALHAAVDNGITIVDVADVYGDGVAEEIVGSALGSRREGVVLCTKAGRVRRGLVERMFSLPFSPRIERRSVTSPAHLRAAIEGSLRRLRTDRIDLFLLHSPPLGVLEQDAVFEMLEDLERAGTIRHYGVSPQGAISTREALAWLAAPGISALQIAVNALHLPDLDSLVPAAEARGVGLIARQPYHRGALLNDERIRRMAAAHPHYSTAQLALRFALQLDGLGPVLAGMSSAAHVEENLAAVAGPPLSDEQMNALRTLAPMV